RHFRTSLAALAVLFQCDVNGVQQFLIAERLCQEFDGSCLHGADAHLDVAMPSDEDNRNGDAAVGQLALEIEATHSAQPDVKDKATVRVRSLAPQKFLGGSKMLNA